MSARLSVDVAGAGEPVVLLHGLATDRRIWKLVVPMLARRRMVVTVDIPGFGESEPAGAGFSLEQVADRIARGLAARGVRGPYDLVGHSLGGGIALTLASTRPRAVRRLVLAAPAGLEPLPPGFASALAAVADSVLAIRREAAPLASLAWGRRLLLAGVAADGAALSPALARQMVGASASARRTGPALRTISASDLRPLLARLREPPGVIWGEADLTLPIASLRALTAVRPDARVIRLPGAGHVPMVECPEAFVAALEQLLLEDDTTPSEAPSTVIC